MSGYSDQWVTLSSEAVRARRDELRRRRRRRRRGFAAVLVCLLAGAAALALLVFNRTGARAARTAHHHVLRAGRHPRPRLTPAQLAAIQASRENAAINRLLARQPFIRSGGPERREIALTFDDGPGPYTPHLLGVLKRLRAPGTFFEVGFMFQWFAAGASAALHDGNVIGDHTETHPHMALLPVAVQRGQILDQTQWTGKIGAPFPRLWRPPYGSFNAATLTVLQHLHMLMVLWTVDSDDYLRPGVPVIVHRAVAGARPGAIILLHDAGGDRSQTIQALPLIVHALRRRGYQLVTVPQLILDDPPPAPEPLPKRLPGD